MCLPRTVNRCSILLAQFHDGQRRPETPALPFSSLPSVFGLRLGDRARSDSCISIAS